MTTDAESLPAAAEPTAAGSRFWIVASDDAPRRHDPADSFANLDEALAALGRRPAAETVGDDPRIVRQAAGAPPRIAGKPRHRFFVIVQSADGGGDGTESSPWWGLGAATAALIARSRDESLLPKDGDHIQISCRHVYAPSPLESRKRRSEQFAAGLFGVMAAALVLPLIAILLWLVVKAWPALSPAFIWENPRDSMTAGGIWAPLVGTFFLVFMSLLIAAPVGILAGVYLHEYARDNWFTRLINLAVVNLAGSPTAGNPHSKVTPPSPAPPEPPGTPPPPVFMSPLVPPLATTPPVPSAGPLPPVGTEAPPPVAKAPPPPGSSWSVPPASPEQAAARMTSEGRARGRARLRMPQSSVEIAALARAAGAPPPMSISTIK